jgi:hypothetical protein
MKRRFVLVLLVILSPVAADDTWDGDWTIDGVDSVSEDLMTRTSGDQVTVISREDGQRVGSMSLSFDPVSAAAGEGYVFALEVREPHGNATIHAYEMSTGDVAWTLESFYLPVEEEWSDSERFINWGPMTVHDGLLHLSLAKGYYFCDRCNSIGGDQGYERNYIVRILNPSDGTQVNRIQIPGQETSTYDVSRDPVLEKRGESVRTHPPQGDGNSYYIKDGEKWGSTTSKQSDKRWIDDEIHDFQTNGEFHYGPGTNVTYRIISPSGVEIIDVEDDPSGYPGDLVHGNDEYVVHYDKKDSITGPKEIQVRPIDNWTNVLWEDSGYVNGRIAVASGRAWVDRPGTYTIYSYDLQNGTKYTHDNVSSRFTSLRIVDDRVLLSSSESMYWWDDGCYVGRESFDSPEIVDSHDKILVSHGDDRLTQMDRSPLNNQPIGTPGILYSPDRLITNDIEGTEKESIVVNHSVEIDGDPLCPIS